ncbi:MAG TPA: sugar phosphate isomerase/epimerase [Chthonomonadaceae bacterium]|nr:sugar phosphate isomerase/epimerase [Chthonomonadaceae bacterium]
MAKIPIGLQLYSVREDAKRDLPGVLAAVSKMGYEGVEFAGYYGHSAEDIRRMLDDNGLKCCGTHTGLDTLLGDKLPATIEFNQTIGNRFLIVPWLGEELRDTKEALLATAQRMNDISDQVQPHGMRTGYHNHTFEFHPMAGGELPWDIFFGNTRPEVVMQFDTGNAMHAGAEAPPFLRRYPGRATTVHLKEYSSTNDKALIGEGEVDWKTIFDLCENVGGTEWYIVEQESYAYPPLECVDRCLQALRAMGK